MNQEEEEILETLDELVLDLNDRYSDDDDSLDVFSEDTYRGYTDEEYQKMVEAIDAIHIPKVGVPFEAVMVGEDDNNYLLDSRFKDYIRIPKTREERNFFGHVKVGDIIDVVITSITDKREYSINGSVAAIYKGRAHEILQNMEVGSYVMVRVEKLTPAGYTCVIEVYGSELDAFLPQMLAGVNRIPENEKASLVGKTLEMCVETFAADKGTWIVSRRKYLELLIPQYMQALDAETLYKGTVTDTKPYGVFVEFSDCLTGMIHKTALLPEYRDNFKDIKAGDEMEFYVKEIDYKKGQIVLIQQSTIWDNIEVGQEFDGVVIDHKPFGTLVSMGNDTTGLIRASKDEVVDTSLVVGTELKVKVSKLDKALRRIYITVV